MYKINNIHTNYNKDIKVLCSVEEGFEKAIDIAIEELQKCRYEFCNSNKY